MVWASSKTWPNLSPDPIDYNIAQIDQLLVKGSKEISLEFRCWIWGQVSVASNKTRII